MSERGGAFALLPAHTRLPTGATPRDPRSSITPLALAALAALCVAMAIGPWPVGVFQDDGIYLVLAKSLASGEGYRFLHIPGAPNATHYPPLFPAVLAMLWKAWPQFPDNVILFKFANALFVAVASVGVFRFARQWGGLGEGSAAVLAIAAVCCTPVMLLSVMVLSEPFFLALLIPTLGAGERATRSGRVRDAVVAGLATGVLSMVRSFGVLVAPAVILVLMSRRRWSAAMALAAAAVVAIAPWQVWVASHAGEIPTVLAGKYGSYFGWWFGAVRAEGTLWLARVVAHNVFMLTELGWASTATEGLPLAVRVGVSAALSGFFVGGLIRLARRIPATASFLVLYLLLVVLWPFAPARFVWGVWPIVLLCFASGLQGVWRMTGPGIATRPPLAGAVALTRWALLACAALLFTGYAAYNVKGVNREWWTTVQRSVADRARPLAEWTIANTKPTDVLATDDDVLIYLYTGRRTIPNSRLSAQEHLTPQTQAVAARALHEILRAYGADYVLASTRYGIQAATGLEVERPAELRLVTTLRTGAVFAPVTRAPGSP